MDRLRKSFRESFRKRKEHSSSTTESATGGKPAKWVEDETGVKMGTCNFHVKYLGCVEVFESRGMQVCEEALKVLRNSRKHVTRGTLFVTGDGLRVVDDDTKGLIVDQTIEKVSFCAPDRNHERGFSYICRDGTTRRWMCHGFIATRDSGERLSHAVGCAFAVCLEKKQKRDKECDVTMTFDKTTSTFTRSGSFRTTPITERLLDPQECKPTEPPPVNPDVKNPYAIERPHATPGMLERQGSFRGFSQLNKASPFKRQLSLRIGELPSNLERKNQQLDRTESNGIDNVSPIPEGQVLPTIPANPSERDALSALAQEVSQGLSLLASSDDPFIQSPVLESDAPKPNGTTNTTSPFTQHTGPSQVPLQAQVLPIVQTNPWAEKLSHSVAGTLWSEPKVDTQTIQQQPESIIKPEEWLESLDKLPKRNPPMGQLRSVSLGNQQSDWSSQNFQPTNPFVPTGGTIFQEVHMV